MKYIIFFLLSFTIISSKNLYSQKIGNYYVPNKLDSILIKNVDTVIAISFDNGIIINNSNTIYLTIKADTINLFKYEFPYLKREITMPRELLNKLNVVHNFQGFLANPYDLNSFFKPIIVTQNDAKKFWNNLKSLRPLEMIDDGNGKEGCDDTTIFGETSHRLIVRFTFLTKNKINHYYFYDPEYFEKRCPGNKGRKTMIKIIKMFSQYETFKFY